MSNDNPPTVFACMPTHSCLVDMRANAALQQPTIRNDIAVKIDQRASSLLAHGFNNLWCKALNERFDYFAMLHADICPTHGWLDILMDEMKATGAEVLSCVVPFKEATGLTSTAIGDPAKTWKPRRRLTMTEIDDLPDTFDAADAGYPGDVLLVNSGCFLVDLSKPWCRATNEFGEAEFHFTINDRIVNHRGQFKSEVESEDWFASRQWARMGVKVLATKKVILNHRGVFNYPNYGDWGDFKEDHFAAGYSRPEHIRMVKRGCPCLTNDDKEIVHLHIPKNGGTSIWQVLGKPKGIDWTMTHASAADWRELLSHERYERAISFAVVRNPYDRLYSAWSYFAGDTPTSPTWPGLETHSKIVKANSGPNQTFEYFLLNADIETWDHFRPQCQWICNETGGGVDVTHILKFESLNSQWEKFCEDVGFECDPLPHRNASSHGDWQDAFTPELIEKANELYAKDFELLPYEMLSPEQFAAEPALTV